MQEAVGQVSDVVTRQLQRDAVTGDRDDDPHALAARSRRGSELTVACGCGGRRHCSGHTERVESCLFCACPRCNGTGRAEWPWRGETGRLALAAYCGHAAAGVLCETWCCPSHDFLGGGGECGPAVVDRRLADWVVGLSRWPREALARAACAAAGAWLSGTGWLDPGDASHSPGAYEAAKALAAVDAHLTNPTVATRRACADAGGTTDPARLLALLAGEGYDSVPHISKPLARVIAPSVRSAGEAPVMAAIKRGLAIWALGGE